ncbi:MAG: hypothetical protein AABX75_00545 [Nanoarchaeota archaeon]
MKANVSNVFGVIAIVFSIILASGCVTGNATDTSADSLQASQGTALALNPTAFLGDGWTLIWEAKTMADWPLEQQKDFASKGITDAAGWRYVRGNESIYVWVRNYDTVNDLQAVEDKIIFDLFSWKDTTALAFGDVGQVGEFVNAMLGKEYNNLFLYLAQKNTMLFIQYTNQIYNGHERYDKTNIFADKRYLIGIAKKIYEKI